MELKEFRADLIPKMRELDVFAKRKVLSDTLQGNLTTAFKGRGMEFKGYSVYTPETDASKIDWKASLRSRKLLVRDYNVDRNFYVYFLVDVSDSMLFGSIPKLKCEYVAEIVATLCFGILSTGSGIGFGLFTDHIVKHIQPRLGKRQYYVLKNEMTNPKNYGGKFDLEKSIKLMLSYLKQKTLVFIISDFIGVTGNWFKYLEILSEKFEVIGLIVRDPRDRDLPPDAGQFLIQDPYSDEKILIDVNQYRELYREYVKKEEDLIRRKFELIRSDYLLLQTDQPYGGPMQKLFRKRGLKWR